MAQKLRKHGKNWKKMSVGCDIDFTILLSMLKVKPQYKQKHTNSALYLATVSSGIKFLNYKNIDVVGNFNSGR